MSQCCLPSYPSMRDIRNASLLHMLIQCTPLLMEKAGVAPDVILRFTAHKQARVPTTQALKPMWTKSAIGVNKGFTIPGKWSFVTKYDFTDSIWHSLPLHSMKVKFFFWVIWFKGFQAWICWISGEICWISCKTRKWALGLSPSIGLSSYQRKTNQ